MHPRTPTEVVEWARRHLNVERSFVVDRAMQLEPDKQRRRDPAQLQVLWKDLVANASSTAPGETIDVPGGETDGPVDGIKPPVEEVTETHQDIDAPPDEPEAVDGFDLADLDELTEAPSHAHDIEQKIKATFPGAELTLLPEPLDHGAGGEP